MWSERSEAKRAEPRSLSWYSDGITSERADRAKRGKAFPSDSVSKATEALRTKGGVDRA